MTCPPKCPPTCPTRCPPSFGAPQHGGHLFMSEIRQINMFVRQLTCPPSFETHGGQHGGQKLSHVFKARLPFVCCPSSNLEKKDMREKRSWGQVYARAQDLSDTLVGKFL